MYTRPVPDERGERWQGDHSGRSLRAQISAQARCRNALRMSAALISDRGAAVGQQPGQGPLDLPSMAAQPLAGLHPTPGDPRGDAPATEHPSAARVVVAPVRGVKGSVRWRACVGWLWCYLGGPAGHRRARLATTVKLAVALLPGLETVIVAW
jgi:hypothetical protein